VSFRNRLRRLRREGVPEGALPGVASFDEATGVAPATAKLPRPDLVDERATCGLPGALSSFDGPLGSGLARVTRFEVDHLHGHFQLLEVQQACPQDFALLTGDASLAQLDLDGVVYLDTETTGLSGGTGTYVYMVGLGRFVAGGECNSGTDGSGRRHFEVWQGFLSGPEGEAILLAESARRIRESSGLVSFFGKSFDRHRLQDKMQLCGVEAPFDGLAHLDLYHPCKRLYGGAYEDGRLKTMESELCGLVREDDLPGSLAPAAWFDFLAGRPHLLEGVFRHNLDDVLSLVTLAAHLGRTRQEERASGAVLSGHAATRAAGIARSLALAKQRAAALQWLNLALERGAEPASKLQRDRADLLRLQGDSEAAIDAYSELLRQPEDAHSVPCLLELAKLHEHARRDAASALGFCKTAQALLDRNHSGPEYARLARDLNKRMSRLLARQKT
jgi:uncharacterized protein YprB with RNaseH-like and TPR domain